MARKPWFLRSFPFKPYVLRYAIQFCSNVINDAMDVRAGAMSYTADVPCVPSVPSVPHALSFVLFTCLMCLMVFFLYDKLAAFVNHGAEITVRPGTKLLHCVSNLKLSCEEIVHQSLAR
jgi:hypothetical protein